MYNFVKSGQTLPPTASSAPVQGTPISLDCIRYVTLKLLLIDTLDIDDLLDNMAPARSSTRSRHTAKPSRVPLRNPIAPSASTRLPRHTDYNDSGGSMDVAFDGFNDNNHFSEGNDHGDVVKEEPVGDSVEQEVDSGNDRKPVPSPIKEEPKQISLTQTTKKLKKSAAVLAKERAAAAKGKEGTVPLFKSDPSLLIADIANGASATENVEKDITSVQVSRTMEREWWCKSTADDATTSGDNATEMNYVPLYWTDATETNGIIYLFGRVAVVEPGSPKRFVSCCVAVHGNERNLFVLPKKTEGFKPDGTPTRAGLDVVYADVNKLLVPSIIPRSKGQGFRCKQVKRKYAFEHQDVPREESEYLKVVYSAKHGTPSTDQCDNPPASSSIERIFGASSSALELFLLKRKLMGPSWVLIKNPMVMTDSVSWCKLELSIDVSELA